MVQRYILQGGLIGPHDEGDWVGYEDYKDLDDDFQDYITTTDMEIEGLVARLAEVNAELQKYKDQFPDYVAAADVLAERKRQVSVEGWTPSHDDTHKNNEMAFAAACYAFHAAAASWDLEDCGTEYDSHPAPKNWPWESEWWKPKSARADLVRAGALILAEIERIDRAAVTKSEHSDIQASP